MPRAARYLLVVGALLSRADSRHVDDAAAMIQTASQASQAVAHGALAHSVAGRSLSMVRALEGARSGEGFSFNCTKHPKLCVAPFNCHEVDGVQEFLAIQTHGLAHAGHSNLQSWCSPTTAGYEDYMHACIVEKDLVKAAHIQYEWSLERHNQTGVDELDGSYCFIEGHCTNQAVTQDTTLEEADKMCDERYGARQWRWMGAYGYPTPLNMYDPRAANPHTGFHDPQITKHYLKMACAMGNYHCDVMYCKETYCKVPYYVNKYSHLLPKAPGHLLQSRNKVF